MFGGSNKKVEVKNNVPDGASKEELEVKAMETFNLTLNSFVVQVWDKDYEEFADISDGERVSAPIKVRVVELFPVTFSSELLESSGSTASIISLNEESLPGGNLQQPELVEDVLNVGGGDNTMDDGKCLRENKVSDGGREDSVVDDGIMDDVVDDGSDGASLTTEFGTSQEDAEKAVPRLSSASMVHFRMPTQPPTIENKLRDGSELKLPERTMFLQNIYNAVVKTTGTYLPTRNMYDEIVSHMFSKYPRMAHPQPNMPLGNMKTLWKDRLLYKFRNNRKRADHSVLEVQTKRAKKGGSSLPVAKQQTKIVPQWGMPCYLPPRPASEDTETIKAHEVFMQKEKKKKQPDYRQVKLAMDKTLSDRRDWLVATQPRPQISAVQERYPWLFDEDQMETEMRRLQATSTPLVSSFKTGLQKYAAAIIVKGQGVKKPPQCFVDSVALISAQRGEQERKDATSQAAFLILPKLLREKVDDIFVPPDTVAHNPVHIKLDAESVLTSSMFTLCADGQEVATSNVFFDAVVMWLSAYYVFNLEYSATVTRTLTFVQKVILNIKDQLPTIKAVSTLTSSLNQINMRS